MKRSDMCSGPIRRVIGAIPDAIFERFLLAEASPNLPES